MNVRLVLAEYDWCQSVRQWMVAGRSIFLSLSVGVGFLNEFSEFSSKLFSLCYLMGIRSYKIPSHIHTCVHIVHCTMKSQERRIMGHNLKIEECCVDLDSLFLETRKQMLC